MTDADDELEKAAREAIGFKTRLDKQVGFLLHQASQRRAALQGEPQ